MGSPYFDELKDLKLRGLFVVTGGNRGIGRGVSSALAQEGVGVAIIYRESKDAPDVAKEIGEQFQNSKVRAYQCDVRDRSKLHQTFGQIEKDFDRPIRGVVANAGISVVKPAVELTDDDFQNVFGVNVHGVENTCRVAAKRWMDRNEEGAIVIISSISGQIINLAGPNKPLTQAYYNTSKAGVTQYTKAVAAEWAANRIRVNSVSPGYDTDQTKHMDPEIVHFQRESIPLRRFAEPKDISGPVVFLLSPRARYLTGSDLVVDGGKLIY